MIHSIWFILIYFITIRSSPPSPPSNATPSALCTTSPSLTGYVTRVELWEIRVEDEIVIVGGNRWCYWFSQKTYAIRGQKHLWWGLTCCREFHTPISNAWLRRSYRGTSCWTYETWCWFTQTCKDCNLGMASVAKRFRGKICEDFCFPGGVNWKGLLAEKAGKLLAW